MEFPRDNSGQGGSILAANAARLGVFGGMAESRKGGAKCCRREPVAMGCERRAGNSLREAHAAVQWTRRANGCRLSGAGRDAEQQLSDVGRHGQVAERCRVPKG